MTGMPAFGLTYSDDARWAMVAFLRRLPTLSSEEYIALVKAADLREEPFDPDALPKSREQEDYTMAEGDCMRYCSSGQTAWAANVSSSSPSRVSLRLG